MKRNVIIGILFVFLTVFTGSLILFVNKQNAQVKDGNPIHLFYDGLATQPAFLGMIDMLQLPKNEIKVFAWHRFTKRSALTDLSKINAVEVDVVGREGYGLANVTPFLEKVKELMKQYPNSPLIIWTNSNNINYFFDVFFREINKDKIKHIHLYEDGLGILFTKQNDFERFTFSSDDIELIKEYWFGDGKDVQFPSNGKYLLHHLFPVTYHFFGLKQAYKMPIYQSFFDQMFGALFEDIDFNALKKRLTRQQKEMLYQLVGFDNKKYQKIFKKQKTFMYVSGYYLNHLHHVHHAEISYLKHLMKKYPDYYFLFKPHPSFDAFDKSLYMKENFASLEVLNAQMPYEIFVLADLNPDKIAGKTSSLFYTLKSEQVEGYIAHPFYGKGLKIYMGLSDEKKVSPDVFVPEEPYFYDEKINRLGKEDFVIFLPLGKVFLYQTGKHISYELKDGILVLKLTDTEWEFYKKDAQGVYQKTSGFPFFVIEHTYWKDTLSLKQDDVYCRTQGDCGRLKKTKNGFEICWENWDCENYVKGSDSKYRPQ